MKPFGAASPSLPGFGLALALWLWAGRIPAAEPEARPPRFIRGDVNETGKLDIGDAFQLLNYLFRNSPEKLTCEAAADWNDDHWVDLSDVLSNLFYLFADSPPPLEPFPFCGEDPTPDFPCTHYWYCGTGDFTNGLGMRLIFVPPGQFRMGSPLSERGRFSDEVPHQVVLTCGFYMSATEVTQGQYLEVMGENPSLFNGVQEIDGVTWDFGQDLSRPVTHMSWFDAGEFCRRLSDQENRKFRLPSEAEWEYACRAGTTTRFWFGDMLQCKDDAFNYCPDLEPYFLLVCTGWSCYLSPVGQKEPNPWGFYDIVGIGGEWCRDWYGPYPTGTVVDPQGPPDGVEKVWRGQWGSPGPLTYARSAKRMRNPPEGPGPTFRVVLKLPSCLYGD